MKYRKEGALDKVGMMETLTFPNSMGNGHMRDQLSQDEGNIQMDRRPGRGESLVYLCNETLIALFCRKK